MKTAVVSVALLFLFCISVTAFNTESQLIDNEVELQRAREEVNRVTPNLRDVNEEEDDLDVDEDTDDQEDNSEDDETDDEDAETSDTEEETEETDTAEDTEEGSDVASEEEEEDDDDETEDSPVPDVDVIQTNPCDLFPCKPGKECYLTKTNKPKCRCIVECDSSETDFRVCGTDNNTYTSECELWRTKCIMKQNKAKGVQHLRLDYYGDCKEIQPCGEHELSEYPTRMRSWIKNIYLQMYDEAEDMGGLNEKQRFHGRKLVANRDRLQTYEEHHIDLMSREFQKFYPLYKYPIHWKFGILDVNPTDKYLSKRELEPMRAPLVPLEHCTDTFFSTADANKDHLISLYEWAEALGLQEDDIDSTLTTV
uniref:SPARC n=1 Tax=Ciona intestinalis TaxID=7719 RepID=Q6PVV9_CIOIN|nr:SPARC precursor [Ciona intestinalis]AAT01212.1 SPARC [Ciona intestinalis]|eukprot:NP_001027592.1 SPARC precursor [Ciona intestinalis]